MRKDKKEKLFTDEMHKNIFPFQPPMAINGGKGKPVTGFPKFATSKNYNPNKFK